MKKALRIFVLCLLLIAYVLTFILLTIFTYAADLFEWVEEKLNKSIHKKRGKLKGG